MKENKYFVYALRSKVDGRIYVGFSSNLERRLKEHNSGKTKSTKGYVPWELIYWEEANSRIEARKREIYFKNASGKRKLKKHYEDNAPIVQGIEQKFPKL